jgi:hypothetical protein
LTVTSFGLEVHHPLTSWFLEMISTDTFKWRSTDGHQTSEKILNILSHQGNANQTCAEIPPYHNQNGCWWVCDRGRGGTSYCG